MARPPPPPVPVRMMPLSVARQTDRQFANWGPPFKSRCVEQDSEVSVAREGVVSAASSKMGKPLETRPALPVAKEVCK